eukprot:2866802-Alexandrium_andersonii.AAC.1
MLRSCRSHTRVLRLAAGVAPRARAARTRAFPQARFARGRVQGLGALDKAFPGLLQVRSHGCPAFMLASYVAGSRRRARACARTRTCHGDAVQE